MSTVINGYRYISAPDHPNADSRGYVSEHVLVVSRTLGGGVPDGAIVHHVNGDPLDNRPSNLVVCQDQAYHMLLHYRQRALDEYGDANAVRCRVCGEWDDPQHVYIPRSGKLGAAYHRACHAREYRERERRRHGATPAERRARRFAERNRKIVDRYLSGETIYEIGPDMGISPDAVWHVVNKAGLDRQDGIDARRVRWECGHCGASEMRTPGEARKYTYCSRSCAAKANDEKRARRGNGRRG